MIGQIVTWQIKEQKPFGYIVTNGKESALLHESQCEGELQVIQARFHMSKAAFKRALGRLMKEEKVYQQDGWTYIQGRDEK